jgi:hypothetical protein
VPVAEPRDAGIHPRAARLWSRPLPKRAAATEADQQDVAHLQSHASKEVLAMAYAEISGLAYRHGMRHKGGGPLQAFVRLAPRAPAPNRAVLARAKRSSPDLLFDHLVGAQQN